MSDYKKALEDGTIWQSRETGLWCVGPYTCSTPLEAWELFNKKPITLSRKDALNLIVSDAASYGKDSGVGLRLYIENRISYSAYKKAVLKGVSIYKRNQTNAK